MLGEREGSPVFFLDGPMKGRFLWWKGGPVVTIFKPLKIPKKEEEVDPNSIISEGEEENAYEELCSTKAGIRLYILKNGWLAKVLDLFGRKTKMGWDLEIDPPCDLFWEVVSGHAAGKILAERLTHHIVDRVMEGRL